ncbi:MAG: hypothetical protein, partial [Olavius algarvensis Gamma 1 endosymbiont]
HISECTLQDAQKEDDILMCMPGTQAKKKTKHVVRVSPCSGCETGHPSRPALGRQLVRAADAPLRGHGFGTSRLRQTPTT